MKVEYCLNKLNQSGGHFGIPPEADVCVYDGARMYEATIGTAGAMQIGGCTLDCNFLERDGGRGLCPELCFRWQASKAVGQGSSSVR